MLRVKLEHLDPAKDPMHDFRNFLYYHFTEVLGYGEPDPIQYRIADWMQTLAESNDGITRKQVQAMRGCGKSVVACCFIAWLWYCNPTIRVLVLSSVAKKANELAGLVKQLLDSSPLLQHLRPDPERDVLMYRGRKAPTMKKAKNTEDAFDVRGAGPGKDPSFAAYPVFGGWTGSHPDIIIPDDVEIPENSLTVLKRGRLFGKLRECESLIMEGGYILYMGTPQTEESIYNKLDDAGYRICRWPAELPPPDDEVRCRNVDEWLVRRAREEGAGQPSYPERFPMERLLEKKAMGLAYYNLQMLLDTALSDEERYPLKLKNLIVFDTPADMGPSNIVWGTAERITHIEAAGFTGDYLHRPALVEETWLPFQDKLMFIDPSGGGADSVGWCVAAFLNGVIYVLDAGGLAAGSDGTSDAVMAKLAKTAATYDTQRVVVESNYGGGKELSPYAKLLQPHLAKWVGPCEVQPYFVTGRKEPRIIDTLRPIMENHRLVFSERAAKCYELTYQLTHITPEAGALGHDDVIDALHGAVAQFTEHINLDPEVREQQRRHTEAVQQAHEWDQWASRRGFKPAHELTPIKEVRQRDPNRHTRRVGRWRM